MPRVVTTILTNGHPGWLLGGLSVVLSLLLSQGPLLATAQLGFRGIPGDYCRYRKPVTCCPNREDECTVPILDTLCYCDMFCDRSDGGDCCPDFEAVCMGIEPPVTQPPTPKPVILGECTYGGSGYVEGERILQNCNWCACTSTGWKCETDEPCMIQDDLLEKVQRGGFTWQAQNYTKFWGKTLSDGVKYRLGTIYPEKSVENMNEVLKEVHTPPPATFDARDRWPDYIHGVRDQGNCGASWAFSTTAISADRLAILSEGKINPKSGLSPQQLLSCNQHRQRGCDGGYLDRAWWFIRKFGSVTTNCYPYESGQTNSPGQCSTPKDTYTETNVVCPSGSSETKVYKMTPPYRISTNEEEIKKEIEENGPVQATFLVHEDFYMYAGGVYQYADLAHNPANKKEGYHSVRILGWGEEAGVKYWLCANSWGTDWGENGLFKIVRGTNHCQVEAFIIGAWGKGTKRRKFRVRKHKKLRTT